MHWNICFIYSVLFILVVTGASKVEPHNDISGKQAVVDQSAGNNGGTTKQPMPSLVLAYTCNKTKQINIFNISGGHYENIQVLKKESGHGFCSRSNDNKEGLQSCITTNTEAGKVRLLYQHETSRILVAGTQFAYFELTCEERIEVKIATVELQNQLSAANTSSWTVVKANQHSGKLTIDVQPKTNLHVGDPLTLKMTIPGSDYKLRPNECTAKRNSNDVSTVTIWTCAAVTDADIISDFTWGSEASQQTVTIPMFAFKFIDSEDLIIECSANICPSTSQHADCLLNSCHSRRRRGLSNSNLTTGMNIPVKHASVSMKVKDPLFNRGSGLTTIWYAYFVPAFLMIGAKMYL